MHHNWCEPEVDMNWYEPKLTVDTAPCKCTTTLRIKKYTQTQAEVQKTLKGNAHFYQRVRYTIIKHTVQAANAGAAR